MHDSEVKSHSLSLLIKAKHKPKLSFNQFKQSNVGSHRVVVRLKPPKTLICLSSWNHNHLPHVHNKTKAGPEFKLSNWSFYFHHKNTEKQGLGQTQTYCTEADSLLWLLMLWELGSVLLEEIRESLYACLRNMLDELAKFTPLVCRFWKHLSANYNNWENRRPVSNIRLLSSVCWQWHCWMSVLPV